MLPIRLLFVNIFKQFLNELFVDQETENYETLKSQEGEIWRWLRCAMIYFKPHFVKRNEYIGPKAQNEENVGDGKGNYKMRGYVSDKPWGCQVQYDPHK